MAGGQFGGLQLGVRNKQFEVSRVADRLEQAPLGQLDQFPVKSQSLQVGPQVVAL